MVKQVLAGLLAMFLLAGCSAGADMSAAESGIAKFHNQLNAGEFDAIYREASKEFKDATPDADFIAFLKAIHGKLGKFQSGKTVGWKVNYTTAGNIVALTHQATYERGEATESFIFRMKGKKAALHGYNINSTALIVN